MELINEGPIKKVILSDKWERTADKPDSSTESTLTNFALKQDQQVVVQFYYDGNYAAEADGKELLEILAQPPHVLTPEELPLIYVVSGGAGHPDYFETRFARTESLRGKTTVVINGTWKSNNMSDYGLFVPIDPDGCQIQEIHFVCPVGKYAHFLPEFEKVMASIEWQS
jgi:hypothetical protein